MARTRDIDKQRAVLSAATWAVAAERGITGLTVRAVAERAGCTTGLVFHTFPAKRDLVAHARELLRLRASARLDALEAEAEDPREALRSVAVTLLTGPRSGEDEARVWVSFLAAAIADATIAEHHLRGNRALLERLGRLTRAVRPDWDDARHEELGAGLAALTEGLNALSIFDAESYPAAKQVEAVERMLRRVDED